MTSQSALPKEPAPSSHPLRAGRALLLGGVGLAIVAGLTLWLAVARPSGSEKAKGPTALSLTSFQEQTGVRVVRVAVTGGGGLIDLRYQVLDPNKAVIVHDGRPPALVDEKTGAVIDGLFMGHAHSGEPRAGVTYPLLFVNAQGLIKRGGHASVRLGNSVLEHVAVQ